MTSPGSATCSEPLSTNYHQLRMADAVGNDNPNGPRNANSPPPTPPSPTGSETGAKMSRKREREVSLEPVTAPISTVDGARDPRDVRAPKKKNKLQLDSTAEEDDTGSRSRSTSPAPQVGSPPQEMKIRVRQISQGVEDLTWRGMKKPDDEAAIKMSVDNHIHSVAESDDDKDMHASSNEPSVVPQTDVPPTEGQSSTEPAASEPTDTNGAGHLQVGHPSGRRDSDSDSADREKGVKRKYPERGTSQGPPESETQPPEPVKRPRDDADKDANPRVTKRPSPPPETARKSPQKASGFMAYASTKSPFSAVKGPNVFASPSSSKPSVFASPSPSLTNTPIRSTPSLPAIPVLRSAEASTASLVTVLGQSPASASTSAFQTPPRSAASTPAKPTSGFGAYASTNSPFKLNRSKSPPRKTTSSATITAFSAYKGGNSFMKPTPKRVQRAGSPSPVSANESEAEDEGDATFGDKLRAVRDDSDDEGEDSKLNLTEQDVVTGEEDEQTMFSVRGKLYALNGSAWKERGVGVLKVNVNELTRRARILMRKDAVHTTLLNAPLFYGMHCTLAQDPRYLRFSVIESGESTHFNLRLSNPQAAQDLLKNIRTHMPDA